MLFMMWRLTLSYTVFISIVLGVISGARDVVFPKSSASIFVGVGDVQCSICMGGSGEVNSVVLFVE